MGLIVRVELMKLRLTPPLRAAMGVALVLGAIAAALNAMLGHEPARVGRSVLEGVAASRLATLALGVMLVGMEYRHRTIGGVLATFPRRSKLALGKAVVLAGVGAVLGIAAAAIGYPLGRAILAARGIHATVPPRDVFTVGLGVAVACGLWALIGAALSAIVASESGGFMLGFGGLLGSTFFGSYLQPGVARFLPTLASESITGQRPGGGLSPVAGGVVLAVYTLVLCGLALSRLRHRDVT
jgi:ABC-type transport system involved in multi-copper enzyme maturation permease subunit